ncbi:hypothetical protein CEXT_531621 [Caerostris extrusa]|uniref:Uncharacterized protein n=1 Tax=Caerostris extrusa TaxID=172846 RepID=A0AAV4XFN9_CAEEX|nr:hypothetical protein CEXT_531621 [Caerostris extrusa]
MYSLGRRQNCYKIWEEQMLSLYCGQPGLACTRNSQIWQAVAGAPLMPVPEPALKADRKREESSHEQLKMGIARIRVVTKFFLLTRFRGLENSLSNAGRQQHRNQLSPRPMPTLLQFQETSCFLALSQQNVKLINCVQAEFECATMKTPAQDSAQCRGNVGQRMSSSEECRHTKNKELASV